jgi:hypothetical protein
VFGHGLEIVPMKDPGTLRTNDTLPLKVLHNGEPLGESVMVYATYMGFSNKTDVFAYTAWATPSGKGIAEIRLLQPGTWMVFINHKLPYPDKEMADQYNYQRHLRSRSSRNEGGGFRPKKSNREGRPDDRRFSFTRGRDEAMCPVSGGTRQ